MIPILNRPVMDYALEMLGKQNIKKIDVSLLERPADIEGHFGDGRHRGLSLTYHLQREAWGDAGAVRWAFDTVDDTVLLLPADILVDLNLDHLMEFHRRHNGCITAVVSRSQETQPYLTRPFLFKSSETDLVDNRLSSGYEFTGIFVIDPEIIQKIPYRKNFTILNDLLPLLAKEKIPFFTYEFSGYWNPIQTFTQYRSAHIRLCAEDHPEDGNRYGLKFITRQGRQLWKGVWVGRNNMIHPSARIASILFSGENNRIEKNVQLGPNVFLGHNIVVDEDATIHDAVILDHTYIGRLMNVQSKVIFKNLVIDILTGEHISIKDQFMLAETNEKHLEWDFRSLLSSSIALIIFILLLPLLFVISLYLAIRRTSIFTVEECLHTDFRWFVPIEDRNINQFRLFRFQVQRKNGAYIPLGKFLEKTRIIDLPQLLNVIKGDLVFVGVKPLEINIVNQLTEDWQKTRFSVPAGMTGLWYLKTDSTPSLDQTLIADTYYAAMRSWKEDLKILLQTPGVWFEKLKTIDSSGK
jgi:NDP-sugar pyrophosphorylase family protein